MQALFGYFTTEESIKALKRTELEKFHSFDPSKHDFADKGLFEARKKLAITLFNQNILNSEVTTAEEGLEKEVLDSVNEVLDDYRRLLTKEVRIRKNEMIKGVHRLHNTYLKLLILPIEIEYQEQLDCEKGHQSHIAKTKGHYPFTNDVIVMKLKESKILQKEIARTGVNWNAEVDEIKSWYRYEIRTAESLASFFDLQKEKEAGNGIVMNLFKRVIFKNERIVTYLENDHLSWTEDRMILKSMVIKTIKWLQEGKELELAELTKNGKEDFEFLDTLFNDVINQNDFLEEIIQSKTDNWDVNRIALTDRMILKLALVEMMNSPSIPIKVTINEAIEISKMYSTPKSKQFVNGVLDVLSNELTSRGKIRKSGRGLIDNK